MPASAIYNKIGPGYNTTRKADPCISQRLYSLLNPGQNKTYLDIGCGTGNYTIALTEMGVQFVGIDPSEIMLEEARAKTDGIKWLHGYAEQIPLRDNSVNGAIATLTIHHWSDPAKAFGELARVLKPNGRIVFFTFTPEQEKGYWFNHFFPEMMKRGMERSMALEAIEKAANRAGLAVVQTEKYFVQDDLQDLFGYAGKHDPERYFDPEIVRGISYFSIYASKEEVEVGLQKLRECIDNGQFEAIKKQYENELGDYLFVVLAGK
jgi:ubiquinone/menaquinone biosynthesis C-methylase UbiE